MVVELRKEVVEAKRCYSIDLPDYSAEALKWLGKSQAWVPPDQLDKIQLIPFSRKYEKGRFKGWKRVRDGSERPVWLRSRHALRRYVDASSTVLYKYEYLFLKCGECYGYLVVDLKGGEADEK